MNLIGKRTIELLSITMIGDGVLSLVEPRRHLRLWYDGPRPWRRLTQAFLDRPVLTRALGFLSAGAGLFLASRLRP